MFIYYLSGGLLGDFIYQLSIINENFIKTGKKGILYLSNKGDSFKYGLENTYYELYNIIKKQDYIEDFNLYNNEYIDIDLTEWRENKNVEFKNWYIKYSNTYNVDWGKNKWLSYPYSKNNSWNDKVIINTTNYRWPYNINFKEIFNLYKNDLLFVSYDYFQYNYFTEKTGINIDYYKPINFDNLCNCINNCKLFIGSQSAPLHIAFAMKKNIIIGECIEDYNPEYGHHYIKDLDHYFLNIRFNI